MRAYFGNRDTVTIGQFARDLLFTREGRMLALVGNVVACCLRSLPSR